MTLVSDFVADTRRRHNATLTVAKSAADGISYAQGPRIAAASFVPAALSIAEPAAAAGAAVAAAFYTEYSALLLGIGFFDPTLAAAGLISRQALITSIEVTIDGFFRRSIGRGMSVRDAEALARAWAAAALTRHGDSGARRVVDEAVRRDSRATGWSRVASSGACKFCAMLATRGAVYRTKGAAGGTGGDGFHSYHDSCRCVAVPSFR